jgi:hypothetical protein
MVSPKKVQLVLRRRAAASLLSPIAEMALTPEEEEEERLQFQIEKYEEEVFAFGEAQKPDSIAQEEVQPGVPQVGASGKKKAPQTPPRRRGTRRRLRPKTSPTSTKLSRKSVPC